MWKYLYLFYFADWWLIIYFKWKNQNKQQQLIEGFKA